MRPTVDEVRDAARTRLAAHQLPRRVILVAALPRTAAGKVQRAEFTAGPG